MSVDLNLKLESLNKAPLLDYAKELRSEHLVCLASLEALRASLDARALSIIQLQKDLDEALRIAKASQDREAALRKAEGVIGSRADLLLFAKRQAAKGIPCYVQGDFVFHRLTKAVLAQVSH